MKTSLLRVLAAWFLVLASAQSLPAYQLEQLRWPYGAKVVMHLGLGPTPISLQDGMSSWNASAADAVDIWNGYMDFISFSSVSSATVPQVSGDGVNSVFFANTIFGDSFGEGTLAITLLLSNGGNASETGEADVVVNNAFRYDSYRGPQQTDAIGPIYDFHRIVLHEFGHVIGLDHVMNNPPGQALMEPIISDLDHLAADDILGVRRTYGAMIYNLPSATILRAGDAYALPYGDVKPNNNPTSYSIVGLPAGLTFDSATGEIGGNATESGVFGPVIIAHGPFADAYGTFSLTVLALDRVPGLLKIIPTNGYRMVADPIRPRIYTGGTDGINMIDTSTFTVTNLSTEGENVSNLFLSLSADSSLLLFTKSTESPPQVNRIDLESLDLLPPLPIPANASAVREGLENRDYVADPTGVFQFDRTTGEVETFFAPTEFTNSAAPKIVLSPDRATLFVDQTSSEEMLTYDVSTAEPQLVETFPGFFLQPIPSPDGQYLYYGLTDGGPGSSLVQAKLPGLNPMTLFAETGYYAQMALGPAGTIYVASGEDGPTLTTFALYDPVSLQPTANVELRRFDPNFYYEPGPAVFDSSGKYLLVSVSNLSSEVWVFSTDLASLPPPPPDPTKNLLNISTRARAGMGDDAMIGGFIVQGPNPKKVMIRGIGPSLLLDATLSNPVLDLYDASGKLIATNDNWTSDRVGILATQVAPGNEREAAILVTLAPGAYTAIVHDLNNQPGLALVEVYDLDPDDSLLANISTRGKVETGDDVMIGGFIIGGTDPTKVLVRAIGPSLAANGIVQPLADPVLELHDGDGTLISTNNDWRSTQQAEIIATGIAPTDDRESAILATLTPGAYTAIVRGEGSATGVALVEVYNLDSSGPASSQIARAQRR